MPDHVHIMISIPPKYAVSQVVGFIKGKSAIHVARMYAGRKRNYVGQSFLGQGLFRIDGGPRRAGNTRVHTAPGERGSSSRSNATDVADPFRGLKEPQAPFMPLRAAHKTKAPGFAGGYLLDLSHATGSVLSGIRLSKWSFSGVDYEFVTHRCICQFQFHV